MKLKNAITSMESQRSIVIHPPQLEDEIQCHLSALPVPAISASRSERLISIAAGQKMRHFVVEPYKMDLTRRRSTDPRWLIVHLYNPDIPALAIGVGAQGPLTFKEPTPLLSNTKVAEEWAMGVIQNHLREAGVGVRCVSYEPNGPTTFPDYRARLNGTPWDFEITRVLGDILENRHILDQPRDARRNMDLAVQSPPIDEKDISTALDRTIKNKEGKDQPDGITRSLCLVLLNALDLDIRKPVERVGEYRPNVIPSCNPGQWLLPTECRIDKGALLEMRMKSLG